MSTLTSTPDPEFSEAFAQSLGQFLDAMSFSEPVVISGNQIVVPVSDDLVVYLDVRARRRRPVRAGRRRHLTVVTSTSEDAVG